MFAVRLYPTESRLLLVGRSVWDVPEAERFCDAVRLAFRRWGTRAPLRVFADLSEHDLQSSAVSVVNARTAALIRAAPIERYALTASQTLVKMQARRLLAGVGYRMFAARDEAAAWLDWPIDDLDRALAATRASERMAVRQGA